MISYGDTWAEAGNGGQLFFLAPLWGEQETGDMFMFFSSEGGMSLESMCFCCCSSVSFFLMQFVYCVYFEGFFGVCFVCPSC